MSAMNADVQMGTFVCKCDDQNTIQCDTEILSKIGNYASAVIVVSDTVSVGELETAADVRAIVNKSVN